MTDTKPTRFRRVMNHLDANKDIYVPLVIAGIGVTIIAIVGTKIANSAAAFEQEAQDALAAAVEGSRLLIDPYTGDYVIWSPAD